MSKVKCRNCDWYEPIIHSCLRIDQERDEYGSVWAYDDTWCSTEEGAIYISDEEFDRKWWGHE